MRALVFIALAGCGFEHGALDGVGDARGDGTGSANCAWSYTPTNFDPCMLPAPMPFDVTTATLLDPTTTTLPKAMFTQSDGTTLVVIHLSTLNIAAQLGIGGSAPTVFAVDGDVTIRDQITTASGNNDATQCASLRGVNGHDSTASTSGAGGGGGAGGADVGGAGGDGAGVMAGTKGFGGANLASNLSPLRAGCAGGKGGRLNASGTPPEGGRGGGAIQISTNSKIVMSDNGFIDAAGRGGSGPTSGHIGGGGGGGGGGIFLEGPMIEIPSGTGVCADGGSGGEGGGQSAPGFNGNSGGCSGITYAVTFQNFNTNGGDGGRGSFRGNPSGGGGGNGQTDGGGGGGGGAVGWIRLKSPTLSLSSTSIITPAPQTN